MPNRIAVYITALAALAAAVAPVVADMDIASTAGIIGGVLALAGVVSTWLVGWQKFEERTALEPLIEEQLTAPQGTTLKK